MSVTLRQLPDGCYVIDTAGWVAPNAIVSLGPCRCGNIEDGIAIDLCGGREDFHSVWRPGGVISFADWEAIYLAAKESRERQQKHGQTEAGL